MSFLDDDAEDDADKEDDAEIWRSFSKHIQKLPAPNGIAPPIPPKRINLRYRPQEVIAPYRRDITYLQLGTSPDIDKGNAEKLKRGKYPIEGRLDLHGSGREEAYKRLLDFIRHSYGQGKRCVLVVTGKGLREDGTKGVIRTHVPLWLNEPEIRPYLLAFRYAKVADGGEGALYVLLKRKVPGG